MTTWARSLPAATKTSSDVFSWHRMVWSFLLTLIAMTVFFLSFAVGYTSYHADRIVPGVQVGGVSLDGLDRKAAAVTLRESPPSLSRGLLSVTFGDAEKVISYSAIGRDYNIELMLDQAFAMGHGGSLPGDFESQLEILINGVSIRPSVTWDDERLAQEIGQIALAANRFA